MVVLLAFSLGPVSAQGKEPAKVFKPAIDQIWGKTPIPILLPTKLPAAISEKDVKLALGDVSSNGYGISLYYDEIGTNATFAASFAAFRESLRDVPNVRRVTLANGIVGKFRPVSCGGSCAPANLWWEQNGVTYQIQIKLRSDTDEKEQEKILVESANSSVTVRR